MHTTWMNLEDIMLSEVSHSQKDKYCMILLIWSIQESQNQIITLSEVSETEKDKYMISLTCGI